MLELEEAKLNISKLRETLEDVGDALDLKSLKAEQVKLKAEQEVEGFWNDIDHAQEVSKHLKNVEKKINEYNALDGRIDDLEVLIELCIESGEDSDEDEILAEMAELDKEIDTLRLATLFTGKYDENNAIITLHAGAGGTEAQDWCSMLYRMYTRYCERSGFKVKELDLLDGDEAGIKSVTFLVDGDNAYGYLKAEKGVHRLVRISPFDSNARRHTSFSSVEVMPEIINNTEIEIRPEDLKVDTYRSSGAGGQHVNKTESAIRITHLPTGIIVQCQNERSQIQNREQAMNMLKSKLIERQEREQQEKNEALQGTLKKIEWGSQIRSYVFCPYTMVKDHRTGYETGNITAVMDGDIEGFIVDYLKKSH